MGLLAVVLVVAVGCQAKAAVDVRVNSDGSGEVRVRVAVDAEAAHRLPAPTSLISADDLRAGGWRVDAPKVASDGSFTIEAVKAFDNPAQADQALAQLSGSSGPLPGWHLARSTSLRATTWKLSGAIDLSKGAAAFGDAQLTAALGNRDVASLLQTLGRPGDPTGGGALELQVTADLAGSHWSSPTLKLGDQRHDFQVSRSRTRVGALALVSLVVIAFVALLATSAWAFAGRRRGA